MHGTKIINPTKIAVVILLTSVLVIIFSSQILYKRTVNLLTQNLRERLLTISITGASSIKASDLAQLQSEEDWQKPEWATVVNQLHKAKYSNKDIVYMYIFRKKATDPSQMEFVADADSINPYLNISEDQSLWVDVNRDGKVEPEGPDKLQWPGQDYPEAVDIPEAFEAYNEPLTSAELYTDDYGTVLTGYAPIKDESGNTVAVLATDIKADDFYKITNQTFLPFLIFIASLTLIISILVVFIILAWKRYANSLEGLNKALEDSKMRLEQTNIKLEDANDKLKSLDKLKTEFLSLASHQLRSPLTAIIGYTSMLGEGDFGKVNDKQKETVDKVMESSKHLKNVVEDLLNVAKIEQGGMQYTMAPFDFEKTVKELENDLVITAQNKGLSLVFETDGKSPYTVNGDLEKIRQVVLNLTDNAIKYTRQGSIQVNLTKDEAKKRLRLAIKDTGMGITPEIKETLFKKFARGEGGKMNTSGSGLGLYLAKEIVEAHKGRVWVESAGTGQGSTFYVELDLVA